MDGIVKKYHPELLEPPAPPEESSTSGGQDQQIAGKNDPKSARPQDKDKRRSGGATVQTAPRSRRSHQPAAVPEQEVKSDGQT